MRHDCDQVLKINFTKTLSVNCGMPSFTYLFELAQSSLLLGTHRRNLPQELTASFPSLGIDAALPANEQLLEAIGILDRLKRTELPPPVLGADTVAPLEAKGNDLLSPKAARALELTLGPTYQPALPELLGLMRESNLLVPPHLITKVLDTAATLQRVGQQQLANQFLSLTGNRGKWLAEQHPDWCQLLPLDDFAPEYKKLVMPSEKAACLRRWRNKDPEAARLALITEWDTLSPKQQVTLLEALKVKLSAADIPFLKTALQPRRKEVRRLATRLLLQLEEAETTALFQEMAGSWLDLTSGNIKLLADRDHLPILEDHGFYDKKLGLEASLLANLPPAWWSTLSPYRPLDAFSRLLVAQKAWLPALIEAVNFYDDSTSKQALCRHLLQLNLPQAELTKKTTELYALLTAAEYLELCQWGQKNVEQVYRTGSVLRHISFQCPHPWPSAFCKLLIREFTDQLSTRRAYYGYVPHTAWKLLPYRIDVNLFPWLRQQLFAATDRSDQMGSVATKMLQVVSFRKAAIEAITQQKSHQS